MLLEWERQEAEKEEQPEMSAADLDGEVVSTQEECPECSTTTTRERSFDELAKGLANGKLSRRKALGMLGGAVMGSVLASVPGIAWAAKPACAGGATKLAWHHVLQWLRLCPRLPTGTGA